MTDEVLLSERPVALTIARAGPDDLATVLAILEEAATWLTGRGIDQWQPGSFAPGPLAEGIAAGRVYLARWAGQPAGTMTLQWSDALDRRLWGDRLPEGGYVHKLAVRRPLAGRGIGAALLGHAARVVAAAGKPYLRLDCLGENAALCAYYEGLGFVARGAAAGKGWTARLYERPAPGRADRTHGP